MKHRWVADTCECGARRLPVPGKTSSRPFYWYVDAAGLFCGRRQPECTRTRRVRRHALQLPLFQPAPATPARIFEDPKTCPLRDSWRKVVVGPGFVSFEPCPRCGVIHHPLSKKTEATNGNGQR